MKIKKNSLNVNTKNEMKKSGFTNIPTIIINLEQLLRTKWPISMRAFEANESRQKKKNDKH